MENEFLFNLVDEYFDKNPGIYFSFDYQKLIPNRKLKNAIKLYAPYNKEEEIPILLVDDTLFRSAKFGLLVTNTHIYFRLREDFSKRDIRLSSMLLSEIYSIKIKTHDKGADLLVNERKVGIFRVLEAWKSKQTEADILNKLFEIII